MQYHLSWTASGFRNLNEFGNHTIWKLLANHYTRRLLACKHLVVLSESGLLHLINDTVRTKSSRRNFDLLKVSDLARYPADTGARIVDIELELLSGLEISR